MAHASINSVSYKGNSTVDVSGTVYDMDGYGNYTIYISFRPEGSNYKDFRSMYTNVSNPTNVDGVSRDFKITGIRCGYLSNNTRWYVSAKCGSSISSETSVYMPFEGSIPDDFIIAERPTQQTQNVIYNSIFVGEAGTCVANALASIKNIQETRNGKKVLDYSVSWLYGMAGDGSSEYLMYATALNSLQNKGMPPYQVVSNNIGISGYPDIAFQRDAKNIYVSNNTADMIKYSLPQKIGNWTVIGNETTDSGFYNLIIEAIKTKTVMITINIDKSIDDVYSDGIVGGIVGTNRGGHAMALIGVKTINSKKYWVCQNSWTSQSGHPKGDNGLYYIPFSWFTFSWDGINGFYIIEDDLSAPDLPPIPDTINPPKIDERMHNQLIISTNRHSYATKYQFRYCVASSQTYYYTDSYSIQGDRVITTIGGLKSGTTYELCARAYIGGGWSSWSNQSIGTTSPYECVVDYKRNISQSSIKIKLKMDEGFDGGGYTGARIRLYRVDDGSIVWSKYFEIYKDIIIDNLEPNKSYRADIITYYTVNQSNIYATYGITENIFKSEHYGKPQAFSWDTKKIKGGEFNLTASEWNRFLVFIRDMAGYCLIKHTDSPRVNPKDIVSYDVCNYPTYKVNSILKNVFGDNCKQATSPEKGKPITADWLNTMASELNKIY